MPIVDSVNDTTTINSRVQQRLRSARWRITSAIVHDALHPRWLVSVYHDRMIGLCKCGDQHYAGALDEHSLLIAAALAAEGREQDAAQFLRLFELRRFSVLEAASSVPPNSTEDLWQALLCLARAVNTGELEQAEALLVEYQQIKGAASR